MKLIKSISRKALSMLLSVLLVIAALPLISFQAAAADPTPAQLAALASALMTDGIRDANWRNQSSQSPMSPGSNPNATSRAYANGQAVWDAANAYYAAAEVVYTMRTNSTIAASGNEGFTGTTGNYNTANKVRNRVRQLLISGGHMTEAQMTAYKTDDALRYLSGNFTGSYACQDTVTVQKSSTYYVANVSTEPPPQDRWGTNSGGDEPGRVLYPSNGFFGVQRSLKEALLDGTNVLNNVAATQTVTRRWQTTVTVGPHAQTQYDGTNWLYTGNKFSVRRYHHAMTASNFVAATDNNNSANDSNLTADSNAAAQLAALKKWRDFNWGANLAAMRYAELVVLRKAYDSLKNDTLGGTMLSGAVLSAPANADVLAFYGLKNIADGEAFRDLISLQMVARLISEYGEYFHSPSFGKLAMAPTNVLNSRAPATLDPRGGYAGLNSLADLRAMHGEALVKHEVLADVKAREPDIWAVLMQEYPVMDTAAQANWLGNLKWVERIWMLLDMRGETVDFLEHTANYHEGVNPNDIEEDPFDPENPDDPEGPFGDSEYVHDNQAIAFYIETAAGNYGFLQNTRTIAADYSGLVDAIFGNLEAELHACWTQLLDEKAYRWDTWHSEEYWYSYRDFFTPLYGRDFAEMSDEELMRLYQSTEAHPNKPKPDYKGVHANYQQYKSMSAASAAALGPERWAEIYGGYEDSVITPVVDNIFNALAARLTLQMDRAMKIINGLKEANEINITRPHPGQGNITVLQWSTFSQIKKAIDMLNHNAAGKDIYAFLNSYGKLGLLGFDGPPAYPSNEVRDDYWFLLNQVIPAYNQFMSNPSIYFKQTPLAPPSRRPWGQDILPEHKYTDESSPGAHDDPAMKELINRLDTLLGAGGDLRPLLSALDLSNLGFDLKSMGIDPDSPNIVNLTSVVDTMINNLLFNDKTLNMIVEMLYPMILDMLETMFLDEVIPMIDSINPSMAQTTILGVTVGVTSLNVKYYHLYTLLSGTQSGNTFNQLRLYPDLLNSTISSQFPNVKAALSSATAHVENYPQKSKEYPTNAWADSKNPSLYRTNPETGEREFWLNWGIDAITNPAQKETQFKLALSNILQGVFPLLGALLLNKNYDNSQNTALKHPTVAHADIKTNVIYSTDNAPIEIQLRVKGVPGYSKIVTPILECLAGTDANLLATIPTMAQLNGYTSASQLVDAIFNPLMVYINKLKAKPVTEILTLLPNLCYALSLERVPELFRDLNIQMSYWADACLIQTIGWPYLSTFGAAIEGDLPPVNLSDMLNDGLGLNEMLTMDGVMALIFDALGAGFALPPFNAGRIATYGKIGTYTSKRAPAGTQRHYITADKPDVMQALIGWLLGAGLFSLGGTQEEAVAAVLELVKPTGYPPKPVTYSEPDWPDYGPFPEWWADLNSPEGRARAKLDGDYLAANADTVLNVLWKAMFPDTEFTFAQGIIERFESMGANGELYKSIVEMIQRMIRELIGEGGMLENFNGLLASLALLDGKPFDIIAAANQLLDYKMPPSGDVDTISELVDELVKFLAPVVPVLGILMFGSSLDLINVDSRPSSPPKGLVEALLGGAGFEGGIRPILEAFTKPLGLPPIAAWAGTPEEKLRALLDPIENIYYKILEKPVGSLLALLPNLAYFASESSGNKSPLQQSLDVLLNPLYVLIDTIRPIIALNLSVDGLPAGLTLNLTQGLQVDAEVLLNGLLNGIDIGGRKISLQLNKFLLGTFDEDARTFTADKGGVLFALLDQLGLLQAIVDLEMTGLTKLIQYDCFPGPLPIDYSKGAPAADKVKDLPKWFRPSHGEYLKDNADAVLKWAWQAMIAQEPSVKAWLQELLGNTITIENNLEETVNNFFGHDVYIKENLPKLVGVILGLRDTFDSIEVPAIEFLGNKPLSLTKAMARLMFIYDESRLEDPIPLDLHALMAPMDAFMDAYEADPAAALAGVTNAESFKRKLVELFSPLMPLLRVLLAESNALLILDENITSEDNAFLRAYGYNGYETGLLPILLGFGANVPGFAGALMPYEDFRATNEEEQLLAILSPFLYLVDALAADPVHTLLKLLPNAAYFISDAGGESLLRQATAKILHPITVLLDEANIPGTEGLLDSFTKLELGNMANSLLSDLFDRIDGLNAFEIEQLVIGAITVFDAPYNELGLNGEASYVDVNLAELLVKLLDVTGAFELIESSGFAGLIELLNVDDRVKADGPALLDYNKAPQPVAVQRPAWLDQPQAQFLADNADGIINWAWRELVNYTDAENKKPVKDYLENQLGILIESTLTDTVNSLLGGNLFTQDNFDGIVNVLAGLKESLDSIELAGLTFPHILAKMAVIDGKLVDIDAMFAPLMAHAAGGDGYVKVTAANFIDQLAGLLKPFMPLLNVLLTEADMKLIVDDSVNDGKGFLIVDGYDGYRTGLLPTLLGLGADVPGFIETLVPYDEFLKLDGESRMEAILNPMLFLLDQVAAAPVNTLMQVLPNAAYFLPLLPQAVDSILHPITMLLSYLPEDTFDLNLSEMLNAQLVSFLKGLPFALNELIVGEIKAFNAPWEGSYIAVNETDLLIQILKISGALDALDEETLAGLVSLLNLDNIRPDGPGKIDYSKAPAPIAPGSMYPPWLKKKHMAFLADNADGILNWAWRALIKGNVALKDSVGFPLKDTLEDTVYGLLGSYLYTPDNLDMIVSAVLGLKAQLDGIELAGLKLTEILEAAIRIYDEDSGTYRSLNIAALFKTFEAYVPGTPVSGPEDFKDTLVGLLTPMLPLLRVLLAEGDLVFIADEDVNEGNGLVKIFGSNGYETALLPILLGLGAQMPGFLETIVPYETVKGSSDDAVLLEAILDPILFLLDRLTQDLVNTAIEVLPNVAYFISLLPQAIDNLLFSLGPVLRAIPGLDLDLGGLNVAGLLDDLLSGLPFGPEDLVVGEIIVFGEPWKRLGLDDGASYLAVDRADLLAQILKAFGAFELLEENNLTGLVKLIGPNASEGPGPVSYPQVNTTANQSIYKNWWWTKKQATEMSDRAGEFLDGLWTIIYGKPFGAVPLQAGGSSPADSFLRDLLGNALYTQENFNKLLGLVQGAIPELAGIEIVPSRTLGDLLKVSITVGGKQVDIMALLDHMAAWKPSGNLNTQAGFIKNLVDYLEPLAPLLDFMLFGEDIVFLENEAGINGGKGLARATGYEGYRYGLIPIYEALLVPLGAQGEVRPPSALHNLEGRAKIDALLHPLLYAIETLVSGQPLDNLLLILPNLSYFITPDKGDSLLQQSIDRLLYPVNSILGIMDETPLALDTAQLLDDALKSMGIAGLDMKLLAQLRIGRLVEYTSMAGTQARYIRLDANADKADLLTVLLRAFVDVLKDPKNRAKVTDLLADALGLTGFGKTLLGWKLGMSLGILSSFPNGTDMGLRFTLGLAKMMMFFMPMIQLFQRFFGMLG